MSHFTQIATQIKDIEALKKAVQEMGFDVAKDADCRYYFGTQRMDFVIKLPGAYDAALTKTDGSYTLEADFYGKHVSKYLGENGELLMQKYAVEKARIEAFKNGLGVSEKTEGSLITLTMIDPDSGGQITVECCLGGKTQVKTSGFSGQECMKFKKIEEALGESLKFTYTDEFYLLEKNSGLEFAYMGF